MKIDNLSITTLLLTVVCITSTYGWYKCGNPRVCFCSESLKHIWCLGEEVIILPSFSWPLHRMCATINIENTHIRTLKSMHLNVWNGLEMLTVKENKLLSNCHYERQHLFNSTKNKNITLIMTCYDDMSTVEMSTSIATPTTNMTTTLSESTKTAAIDLTTVMESTEYIYNMTTNNCITTALPTAIPPPINLIIPLALILTITCTVAAVIIGRFIYKIKIRKTHHQFTNTSIYKPTTSVI